MKKMLIAAAMWGLTVSAYGESAHSGHGAAQPAGDGKACVKFGPQTPRDIASKGGNNSLTFAMAQAATAMNLCNIHFHNGAEHKARAFSIAVQKGGHGHGGGYQCGISKSLSEQELAPYAGNKCGGVEPGDTIEVHWVYTSCDVEPGPGLASCLSEACANPSLRVESQVFTVVNDAKAMDFADFTTLVQRDGLNQPQALPAGTGAPVEFLGSTTGPKYTESVCSPMQVTWGVRPACAKVNIASLSNWCAGNVFKEDHAHGVRQLVPNPDLLAPID